MASANARLDGDYRHFLNDHPLHTRAMVAYGGLLYDQHHEEEGIRWWEKAIAIDPSEAYAYNSLANDYGHNGHADKALRYYEKAIALVPTEPIFRFNWATTCQMFRNESKAVYGWSKEEIFQHALEQFRQARDLVPQDFGMASTYAETFYMMPNRIGRGPTTAGSFVSNSRWMTGNASSCMRIFPGFAFAWDEPTRPNSGWPN